jgi:RTX calcium-binding nonapeptide repeat (4 copies)
LLATTAATACTLATAMPAAQATTTLVTVPAGCGDKPGTQVPADQLDDHSADTTPLGTATSHYRAKAVAGMITVGTKFGDYIDGTNGVADRLCGLSGNDTLNGEGGNDIILGGSGDDTISGSDGQDTLNGDYDNDTIYGDEAGNPHNTDLADTIDGGYGADHMYGGAGHDTIDGGKRIPFFPIPFDTADGEADGATCTSVPFTTNC